MVLVFAIPGNRPALLAMPGCEQLQLLTVNCGKTDDKYKEWKISKQTKQVKHKPKNNDNKDNSFTNKDKPELDYFVADPDEEIGRAARTKATIEMCNKFNT